MDNVTIKIKSQYDGKTIKEFLKNNNVGRGKVEEIRVNKSSFVNGVYCDLQTILKENDILSFKINEQIDFVLDDKELDVVYEDEYVLVVNKPSGIIIHPDDKTKNNTLVNIVANYYQNKGINRRVRYLHRIDKETTGLVLFAKDFLSEAILLKDVESHNIERFYLALVEGKYSLKSGKIDANIGFDRHINGKMCVSASGKQAITHYNVIKCLNDVSLVEFKLETGRTHQIRVHSSYLHHPLLGDVLYGGNTLKINRVALHSYKMIFTHPITQEKITITKDIPYDMEKIISNKNCN